MGQENTHDNTARVPQIEEMPTRESEESLDSSMDHYPTAIVVDDDLAIMRCVGKCLEVHHQIRVVGYANHAQAGVAMALEHEPDVAILDIHMPGADVFWACQEIVSNTPTKVVFYTGFARDSYLDRCIQAGGSGMVSKHTETLNELGLAVRHVMRGETYFAPSVAKRLVDGEELSSALTTLTSRELDIIRHLGAGRTNRQIATDLDISLRSVEKDIADMKRKLGIGTTNELLVFATNEGIIYGELKTPAYDTSV